MDYQVPDLIEPYYGYKWLDVKGDGTLYSRVGISIWPNDGPFVAKCHNDWGEEWVIRPTDKQQPKIIWDDHPSNPQMGISTGTIIVPGQPPREFKGDPYRPDPDTRLLIELPWGYCWSWEPIPCPHEAPGDDCSCGIYAVNKAEQCKSYKRDWSVLVKVAVWGRVVVASEGVRGQYAYPVEVLAAANKHEYIDKVREHYRIQQHKPAKAEPEETLPAPSMFPSVSHSERNWRDRLGL